MKETIGMRAFLIFLAALLVSGTMVPAVSAENESRGLARYIRPVG